MKSYSTVSIKKESWDAAVESYHAAENLMNKKWGWYVWAKICSPETAMKLRAARGRYLDAVRSRDHNLIVKCCDNLVKGLEFVDKEISAKHRPDDVFYLYRRIGDKNFYFVNDQLDMQRVIPLMKGKDPVVYTMEEIVRVLSAESMAKPNEIKQAFPGAELQSVEFKHNREQIDDEIPF